MGNENAVALAALGLTGTLAGGFFLLLREQNRTHAKLSKSMDKMAESNEKIARATEQGNREAKERNGHLAELTLQSRDQTLEAIMNVQEQKVTHQTVEHETVVNKDSR